MDDFYNCNNCGDEWSFIPEDYDFKEEDYPLKCAHCCMPVLEMVRNVYEVEGLKETLRQLIKRYITKPGKKLT